MSVQRVERKGSGPITRNSALKPPAPANMTREPESLTEEELAWLKSSKSTGLLGWFCTICNEKFHPDKTNWIQTRYHLLEHM